MTVYEKEQLLKWVESSKGFECKESDNQTDLFSMSHTRFDITFIYNKKTIVFEYQCNASFVKPNKKDCLWCLCLDCSSYELSNGNIDEFQREFGYEKVSECIKAFNGCKQNYNKLHSLFTNDEIKVLEEYYEDY